MTTDIRKPIVESKTRRSTWMGRPGVSSTFARVRNPDRTLGKRVSIILWEDDGTYDLSCLTGDGRRADCVVHARFKGAMTPAELNAWIEEQLS